MKIPITFLFCILCFNLTQAQNRPEGTLGIGIQIGQPAGLSLLVNRPQKMSLDILTAWNLNDFYYANLHGLFYLPMKGEENFGLFYGPGVFVGIKDRKGNLEDILNLGVSGTFGISFFWEKLEIYARVTPRLKLIDATEGDIGGGIGIRFFP